MATVLVEFLAPHPQKQLGLGCAAAAKSNGDRLNQISFFKQRIQGRRREEGGDHCQGMLLMILLFVVLMVLLFVVFLFFLRADF